MYAYELLFGHDSYNLMSTSYFQKYQKQSNTAQQNLVSLYNNTTCRQFSNTCLVLSLWQLQFYKTYTLFYATIFITDGDDFQWEDVDEGGHNVQQAAQNAEAINGTKVEEDLNDDEEWEDI